MGHPDGQDRRTVAAETSRAGEAAPSPAGQGASGQGASRQGASGLTAGTVGTGQGQAEKGQAEVGQGPAEKVGTGQGQAEKRRAEEGRGQAEAGQGETAGTGGDADTQALAPVKAPGRLARAGAGLTRTRRRAGRVVPPGVRQSLGRGLGGVFGGAPAAVRDGAAPEDAAGSALARLTTLPALVIMAWLLTGLPLLLAGDFVPIPMVLISAPLLVGLVANGLRVVPARWPRLIPGRARDRAWASWLGLIGTVAVAAGFAAWQLVEHSESVIVLRDQGVYLQTGYWLAQHGSLPIPQSLQAFGGALPGLSFSSLGFFAHGTSVVPALTSGLPMLLAGGFWAQGVPGAAMVGPVLGGLAVLSFGGLTARLAGPQWAPAGAVVLSLALPEQYASRSSLAETAVQVLLFGGLCLLIDALTVRAQPFLDPWLPPVGWRRLTVSRTYSDWLTPERTLAGLGGLALGLGVLASLDSLIYLLPAIPFAGLLLAARRPAGVPFCCGIGVGVIYGLADGYLLHRPFLDTLSHTMALIGVIAAWAAALTIGAVQLLRLPQVRRRARQVAARRPVRWLPVVVGLLAVAALIGLAVRPYVQTVTGTPSLAVYHYLAGLQQLQGLRSAPARTYAEDTLYWVIWYIGLPTVLLGGFGVALLLRQCLRALLTWQDPAGAWRNWALPLGIICAGSAAVLWQPDIVPDQPWASRRLLIVVLPGMIICALWGSAWLTGHARERGARRLTAAVAGLFCVLALMVPTAATTFGAGLEHTGRSGGLRPNAQGMAFVRTNAGELTAVEQLCGLIRHDSAVVIVDRRLAAQFTQAIRGMCDVPTAWMVGQPASRVDQLIGRIQAAGHRPVLLSRRPAQLAAFGGRPTRVMYLTTTQDPHQLTSPPTTPARSHFVIWMLVPQPAAVGT